MIGPEPSDETAASVERFLMDLLRSVISGSTAGSQDIDDAGGAVTGLGRKYHVVRLDGSDKPGGKHHACALFVLDLTHDPAARAALIAYCAAARVARPQLVHDLIAAYLDA